MEIINKKRAMLAAANEAGLNLTDIGYINAHATSTPIGDRAENEAVKSAFGIFFSALKKKKKIFD